MSETRFDDLKMMDMHLCKCTLAGYCPLASRCKCDGYDPMEPDVCYNRIWKDLDATRLALQDMTTRLANDMFVAKHLERIIN